MQTFFFFLSFGSAGGISHAPQQLRQPDVFADRRARSYLLTEIEGSTQLSVSARKVTIGTIMLEGEFEILNFTAPPTTPPLSPKGTFWSGNRFISCASSHHFGYSPTTFFFFCLIQNTYLYTSGLLSSIMPKSLRIKAQGQVEIVDGPMPTPGENQVLVSPPSPSPADMPLSIRNAESDIANTTGEKFRHSTGQFPVIPAQYKTNPANHTT